MINGYGLVNSSHGIERTTIAKCAVMLLTGEVYQALIALGAPKVLKAHPTKHGMSSLRVESAMTILSIRKQDCL